MDQTEAHVVTIASLDGVPKLLDYRLPSELTTIKEGSLVLVPLRNKPCRGVVITIKNSSPVRHLLTVKNILEAEPPLPPDLLKLAIWMSRYYATPLGDILKGLLPSQLRVDRQIKKEIFVSPAKPKYLLRKATALLREKCPLQARLLDEILMRKGKILKNELLSNVGVSSGPLESLIKKKLLKIEHIEINHPLLEGQEYFKTEPKTLNPDQQRAFESIIQSLDKRSFAVHLLFGITGSGKTEIYLQTIWEVLKRGKQAIFLVPEISLTTQTIEKFRSRMGEKIAILHHRLSSREKYDEWQRIKKGEVKIVIGARSALFCPLNNVGLIIVDEEHDAAYKQSEKSPSYHARDVAVMRGKVNEAVVILGSATPSLESYTNALIGKYHLNRLDQRVSSATLPQVKIIDMKKENEKVKGIALFSDLLLEKIQDRFRKGEQTILFLNRRGYHTSLLCLKCSHLFSCPHCERALTFHLGDKILACHLCGYHLSPPPKECPSCRTTETLKYRGRGTEQVERALHAIFPEIRTLRIDGDTTRQKGSHDRFFRNFSTGKSDVLIGTQMITKGLHFPMVTLVAILNCDLALQIPDFRSSETTFQLITQVSGRSGRGELPGEVLIQTQMPDNPTIQFAAAGKFEPFYQAEIESRTLFEFPPILHLTKISFSAEDPKLAIEVGHLYRKELIALLSQDFTITALQPAGYPKIKDLFRFSFLVKGKKIYPISDGVIKIRETKSFSKKVKISVDIDPLSTFF
ncbi:MAG: primosomal protein N' [Chlamydiia bacterium]|nr:primosomal protein N' [Chlamydiia bacterium]